ncbi:MAG TPA: SpoIID/LytB domain-containing protein [Gemmatimonadales bacterium]|nr:SpoIID/LytB domain-containing protein [Gemmatimonadales bacterium]
MRRALPAALLLLTACGHREPPETPHPFPPTVTRPAPGPTPERPPEGAPAARSAAPFGAGPTIRIGLAVERPSVTLGGGTALVLRPAGRGQALVLPAGRPVAARAGARGVTLDLPGGARTFAAPARLEAAEVGGFVRVDGVDHRGDVELRRGGAGITAVAVLSMETYLAGVVGPELGITDGDAAEAVKAQAVVARTYAVKQSGRYARQGFDLLATVSDQRYDGVAGERPEVWQALRETSGQVLTYHGAPVDAFFHSTCGGRTAAGAEVFGNASRPYLRSVSDLDPSGQAYCRASPRFRWREEWDGAALAAALARGSLHLAAPDAEGLRAVEVTARGASGRATTLRLRLRGRDVTVEGSNAIRRALPPPDQPLLRSAAFTLTFRPGGGRVASLVAEGSGSGHGVGLCQWGAIGRARAGQRYASILSAYFPGTRLERRW